MSKDDLGDRQKLYEGFEAARILMPRLPTIIRLDGKGFSKWTKGLARPFDIRLSNLMIDTAKFLCEEFDAKLAYTQSDEISLVIIQDLDNYNYQPLFGGKIQKLCSISASMATAYFNSHVASRIPEKSSKLAFFDSRVWNVPSLSEAFNAIYWRELDAVKNSVSMAARTIASHKQLLNKNSDQMKQMLLEKGIDWNDFITHFKRGSYIRRDSSVIKTDFSKVPEKFVDKVPQETFRSIIKVIHMPTFFNVQNKVEVMFYGEDPIEEVTCQP